MSEPEPESIPPEVTPKKVTEATIQLAPKGKPNEAEQIELERVSEGQRAINKLWETTQSYIAIAVVTTALIVAAYLSVTIGDTSSAFSLLSNTVFVVIGFYFGRTNHQKIGGVKTADEGR